MKRIEQRFKDLRQNRRKALIPFITAGDPHLEVTLDLMHAMVEAGADLLELGVPFSDPMAEGPVIQKACERALAAGTRISAIFETVAQFREINAYTPIILMGYANPLEAIGYDEFVARAAAAGVDGLIVVDLPPEEAENLLTAAHTHNVDIIFLLAPTSSEQRIKKICQAASGFVYYVSLKGVTGAGHLDIEAVTSKLRQIRSFTDLPIGVGFGIKDGASAARIAQIADAVVIGSAVVQKIENNLHDRAAIRQAIVALLNEIRDALDAVA